jgi:hypothetical protein
MTTTDRSGKSGLKQKIAHEAEEMLAVFVYLALFFCALATYSTLLLHEFHVSYFAYGTALLNALIMAKVILLGEALHLGHKHEAKPLIFAAVIKALLFAILMAVVHVLEEVIKHLLHGHTAASAIEELIHGRLNEVLARNLVVFCALIPFFAFRELRRVLGEGKFFDLFFKRGAIALAS